jgi:hypothetical protein
VAARRALKAAFVQLIINLIAVIVSVARDRIGYEAVVIALGIPLTLVIAHHSIQSKNRDEDAALMRVAALMISAFALAMAIGYVTALDPEVKLPFSRAQKLIEHGRR